MASGDWDDEKVTTANKTHDLESARLFMTAVKHGSLRSAAEELGINQSTLTRRIKAFEDDIGAKLLIRSVDGIVASDVGRRIIDACSDLATVSTRLSMISAGLNRGAKVTFSASDGICGYWLPLILHDFPRENPGITVQIVTIPVGKTVDLSSAQSDIDVTYVEPSAPDLVVLGKATMEGRMFGSAKYVEEFGAPSTMEELIDHPACIMNHYLNPDIGNGDWTRYAKLLSTHKNITWQCDSALGLGFAIRSGWGLGSQPSLVEFTEPGMVMLPKEVYSVSMQFWLVAHKDIKDNPAPRALVNWIKERMIPSFQGRAKFEVMF